MDTDLALDADLAVHSQMRGRQRLRTLPMSPTCAVCGSREFPAATLSSTARYAFPAPPASACRLCWRKGCEGRRFACRVRQSAGTERVWLCLCCSDLPPPRKHLEPRPLIAFHPFPLLPPNYLRLFAVAAVPFRGCRFHRHLSMPTPARLPSPQAWACRYPVRWPRQGVAGWVWSAQMCRHRRSHSPLPTSWRQEAVRAVACVMRWGICCSVN